MTHIREIQLADVISKLPEIEELNLEKDLSEKDGIFFCTLGFEDRCTYIPELIASKGRYNCKQSVYFIYDTNKDDNEINKQKLIKALRRFSSSTPRPIECDKENFSAILREKLNEITKDGSVPSITFDISVCTSKLLLLTLKVLFEYNIKLKIVYSEANVYYPTRKDYPKNYENFSKEESLGLTKGVTKIIPSSEYHGYHRDRLPNIVIAFATFKPERTLAVIADIDESLVLKPLNQVIWIIGKPHLPEDSWRIDYVKKINKISDSSPLFNVSTFNYKETIKTLQKIYDKYEGEFHINISPLGSKMQSLGIALFYYFRPDLSIYFTMPKEYNAHQYSEGCKATWQIDFGSIMEIVKLLDKIGQIEVVNNK